MMDKSNMTMILLVVLMSVCTASCFAQRDTIITKIKQDVPSFGAAIRYKFPDKVTAIIDQKLKYHVKEERCFIVLGHDQEAHELSIYTLPQRSLDSTNQFDIILSSTNRYYLYDSFKIPVIFDTDYTFSFMTTVITHGIAYLKFKALHWAEYGEILEAE